MSIPVTATTEPFTPKCMAEIEGAPSFTFRHATVLDKNAFAIALTEEGITFHPDEVIRERIVSELRLMFESENMERNITLMRAYWQAADDLSAARAEHANNVLAILADLKDGDEAPELPPEPVFEFDEKQARDIELLIAQVNAESDWLRLMRTQNLRYRIEFPNLLIRMFVTSTTLPVELQRKNEMLTKASAQKLVKALRDAAEAAGIDPDLAVSQLNAKAMMQFAVTEDEEKNSSSPRSDTTSPAQSQNKKSSGKTETEASASSDPATSEEASGSISSE